jgi:NOL1/NOP2/fmu family ribosome biogenesis protein
MQVLSKKEIREIDVLLRECYNVEILKEFVVLKTSKENKIWITNKDVFELDIEKLRANSIGLYFGRVDNNRLRLSVEGAQIVGPHANKNIAELDEKSIWDFVRGFDVKPARFDECSEGAYVLIKFKNNWLGIGKLENGTIKSVLPKSRKIISLNP